MVSQPIFLHIPHEMPVFLHQGLLSQSWINNRERSDARDTWRVYTRPAKTDTPNGAKFNRFPGPARFSQIHLLNEGKVIALYDYIFTGSAHTGPICLRG